MILLHVSDTHGPIPIAKLPTDFDVLCHTGDWAPEPSWPADRSLIAPYQMDFFRHEATALAAWLQGRRLVFCLGNHDLLGEGWVERELQSAGVDAHAPGHTGSTLVNVLSSQTFFGMREVPAMGGWFEGECDDDALFAVTETIADLASEDDILLTHCPPQSALAGPSENQWGNSHLTSWLTSGAREDRPGVVLSGHIHECFGRATIGASLVVNSACGWSLVDTAGPKVLRIGGRGR